MTLQIGQRDPTTGQVYVAALTNKVAGATGLQGSGILMVAQGAAGSATDFSANVTGPTGANGTLLAHVPSNAGRNAIAIQNLGATEVLVVRSETVTGPSGPTAVAGTTTVFALAAGATGAPPAPYESKSFKGDVKVYGATGTPVAVWQD